MSVIEFRFGLKHRLGLPALWSFLLLASVTLAPAGPLAFNQNSKHAPNPWRSGINGYGGQSSTYYLYGFSTNLPNDTQTTFTLVTAPTNGILEYRTDLSNARWLPVPTNTPVSNTTVAKPTSLTIATFNNNKWSYTCTNNAMSAVGNQDSFTWRMADSAGTSAVATCTITITTNQIPVAMDIYRACAPNTDTTFTVEFYDPDAQLWNSTNPCGQVWSTVVVTPPTNGSFTTNGVYLTYTPKPGATQGFDRFTYKVNDTSGDSTNTANGVIQIRRAGDRAGNLVLVVVQNSLMTGPLTNEIYRLRNDLQNEGYIAKVKGVSPSSASNLWACLVSEYTNTAQFLAGAILIGDLPYPTVYSAIYSHTYTTDLPYWKMSYFETNQPVNPLQVRDIWVSRICAPYTTYGDTTTLLRRALDANHGYRTGASRLPHRAFAFCVDKFYGLGFDTNSATRLGEVWPDAVARGGPAYGGSADPNFHFLTNRQDLAGYVGADCLAAGGQVFEETSDGATTGFLSPNGWMANDDLFRTINQIRFNLAYSCDSGFPGGFLNNMILTRGGGCVLSMGCSSTLPGGYANGMFLISECSLTDTYFRRLIKAGESLGSAAVQYFAFNGVSNPQLMIYGDLSLGVMAAPSNSMPVIRGYNLSASACHSPVQVNASVDAYDPDGSISNIEWFMTGYDCGRAAPTFSGTGTGILWLCSAPGVYTSRVEVTDCYNARTWREALITVTAPTACTLEATSGTGGSVTPAGSIVVPFGSTSTFSNTPSAWYHVASLSVDGSNSGPAAVYTFTNVTCDHTVVAQFLPDLAANNTPLWWLAQSNPAWTNDFNAAETNDADADGMVTWQEWIAGTHPTNRASVLTVAADAETNQPNFLIRWPSASNRIYGVDRATNLILPGFKAIATNLPATPPVNVYTDQVPGLDRAFYRIKVENP